MKPWFIGIAVFFVFFLSELNTSAQSLEGRDIIIGWKNKGLYVYSDKAIKKNGKPIRNLKQELLSNEIGLGDTLHVEKQIGNDQLIVTKNGSRFYICTLDPFYHNPHNGAMAFYPVELGDSLSTLYSGHVYVDEKGTEYVFSGCKYLYPDNAYYNHMNATFTVVSENISGKYDMTFLASIFPFSQAGNVPAARNVFVQQRDEFPFVEKAPLIAIRDKRWPLDMIDSLKNSIVGDTILLARNVWDVYNDTEFFPEGDHIRPLWLKERDISDYEKYSSCQVTDIECMPINRFEINGTKRNNNLAEDLTYRYYVGIKNGYNLKLYIPLDGFDNLKMSDLEVQAYRDSLRLEEEKKAAYFAAKDEEWLKRQQERNEFESQLYDIFVSMYGKEDGDNVYWGRIRFGYTEEMCKNAYRHCGMYREKNNVDTPLGYARAIHFIQNDTILYFINDHLIGIVIYGKKKWSDVLF